MTFLLPAAWSSREFSGPTRERWNRFPAATFWSASYDTGAADRRRLRPYVRPSTRGGESRPVGEISPMTCFGSRTRRGCKSGQVAVLLGDCSGAAWRLLLFRGERVAKLGTGKGNDSRSTHRQNAFGDVIGRAGRGRS